MELLVLIPVVGLALAWQNWQESSAAAAMLHTVSAMILLLFVASLAGVLMPLSLLLMAGGATMFVIELRRHIVERKAVPVPVGIFAVLCVAYWSIHSDSSFLYYDEYSHWGVYLREMLARNQLRGADTNSMHPRYLPGSSLWQYFFALFSRSPEGAAFLAQFVLLLTPLLVLWEKTNWRQYTWHAGILALVIVAIFNFGHGFTSLYVDHLLGAWFAGILLNYLLEINDRSAGQKLIYVLPLLIVVLIKTTGIFFVLAATGIISLLLLAAPDKGSASVARSAKWGRAMLFPAATVILCLSILIVWNANRDSMEVGAGEGSAREVVSRLVAGESIFDESQQAELTSRFIEVVLHQQISKDETSALFNAFSYSAMPAYEDNFRLTTVSLLGLALIALFLLGRTILPPGNRILWAITSGCVWLTAVAYIIVLYFGYRFISATDNGLILSSYIRYAHSMLLPVVLFCFAAMVPAFAGNHLPSVTLGERLSVGRHSLAFSAALAALIIFERPFLEPLYLTQRPPGFRVQTEPLTDQLREKIGEKPVWVYYPTEFSNGYIGQVLRYQLTPGLAYVEQDASTLFGDHEKLKDQLRDWEYLWLAASSPEMDVAAERLIGQEVSDRVFRIELSGNKIQFIPLSGVFDTAGR